MNSGQSPALPLRYMPQLDSLRALAVSAVLFSHYKFQWMGWFHWGWAGVQLFFVISGFLITGILLGLRGPDPATPVQACDRLRTFYFRRLLRICPAYYLTLLVYVLLFKEERALAGWHLVYASNIWMAATGKFLDETLHFWSLCVEEQFYLVWPLGVLFVPRRWLVPLVGLGVASASFYRWAAIGMGWGGGAGSYLPMGNLDALGMGALLALFSAESEGLAGRDRSLKGALAIGGTLLGILLAVPHREGLGRALLGVLSPLALSLIYFWLVGRASMGFTGGLKTVLQWKPFVYVGKISYGLYLYHGLVLDGVHGIFSHYPLPRVLRPLLYMAGTLGVASLSWYCFERPINELRNRLGQSRIRPGGAGLEPRAGVQPGSADP